MTRRPTTPAEKTWRAITGFGEKQWELRDLHARLRSRSIDSLRNSVRQLASAGLVEQVGERPGTTSLPPAKVFVCKRPNAPYMPPAMAPEAETRQQKMWRTMRHLQDWSVAELRGASTTEEVPVDLPCAQAYVSALLKAGVVQVVRPRASDVGTGSIAATYRLTPSCNTGPYAPEVRRGRRVFDVNRRAYVGSTDEVSV